MHVLSIWLEVDWTVHKFHFTFANSSVLIAQIRYPADIFVLPQPYADRLAITSWDMDEWELKLYWMWERWPAREDEDRHLHRLLEGQERLEEWSTAQLECTLHDMAHREWNDVIFVRDVSPAKLAREREM
ncbi:hypothetical protein SUNI508_10458 [Seiridium unicorne]|uniref:Uncharacterized protein n=1 Tax=Seiridium unicorne TaxID=138068 RepID=A0ABR2ULP0_9PEZI